MNDSFPAECRAFANSFTDPSLIEEIPKIPKLDWETGSQFQSSTSPLNKFMKSLWERNKSHPMQKVKLKDK